MTKVKHKEPHSIKIEFSEENVTSFGGLMLCKRLASQLGSALPAVVMEKPKKGKSTRRSNQIPIYPRKKGYGKQREQPAKKKHEGSGATG